MVRTFLVCVVFAIVSPLCMGGDDVFPGDLNYEVSSDTLDYYNSSNTDDNDLEKAIDCSREIECRLIQPFFECCSLTQVTRNKGVFHIRAPPIN